MLFGFGTFSENAIAARNARLLAVRRKFLKTENESAEDETVYHCKQLPMSEAYLDA